MDNHATSNRRIAKNTVFLYLRMLLLMAVSFYTTRVVLNALGDVDYGVYNVVGGIVGFISFINGSMSLASNRFLAYAIGKNDSALLSRTFSMAVMLHGLIGITIVIIAETAGIWYFYNYLNIPEETYYAAMWVYQLSIVGMFLSIMIVPLTSLVIAHERMSAFAAVSLVEGGLKLVVAFLLTAMMANRLILYGWLMLCVTLITGIAWLVYCIVKFPGVHLQFIWYRKLFKEMYSFVGWQFLGSFSWVLRNQGVNLVLNYFFGPVLNAARTISVQVNSGVTGLVQNFQVAVNPQLVKNYAQGDLTGMHTLLVSSSKYSFYLLYVVALPVMMQTEPLLELWLKAIPDYTVVFVRLAILSVLVDALSGTMMHAALASGKIKTYQPVITGILISDIFFVYGAYKLGFPPQSMFVVEIILYVVVFVAKLLLLHKMINLSIRQYLVKTTLPVLTTCLVSVPIAAFVCKFIPSDSVGNLFLNLVVVFVISSITVVMVGMSMNERISIVQTLKQRIR